MAKNKKDRSTSNDLQNIQIKLKIQYHISHLKPGVYSGFLGCLLLLILIYFDKEDRLPVSMLPKEFLSTQLLTVVIISCITFHLTLYA